jgi:hypothetical protein
MGSLCAFQSETLIGGSETDYSDVIDSGRCRERGGNRANSIRTPYHIFCGFKDDTRFRCPWKLHLIRSAARVYTLALDAGYHEYVASASYRK